MSDPALALPERSFIRHTRCERLGTYVVVEHDRSRTVCKPRLDAKYVFTAVTDGA